MCRIQGKICREKKERILSWKINQNSTWVKYFWFACILFLGFYHGQSICHLQYCCPYQQSNDVQCTCDNFKVVPKVKWFHSCMHKLYTLECCLYHENEIWNSWRANSFYQEMNRCHSTVVGALLYKGRKKVILHEVSTVEWSAHWLAVPWVLSSLPTRGILNFYIKI